MIVALFGDTALVRLHLGMDCSLATALQNVMSRSTLLIHVPGSSPPACAFRHPQCFWECGGTLAAPTIASGVIHRVMAFIAPKIIGGSRAPTPVGELGFVEMTQAVQLSDTHWQQVRPAAGAATSGWSC